MPELRCTKSDCSNDAQYVYNGCSYCSTHYREGEQRDLSARPVYLWGIVFWIVIWVVIFGGVGLGWFPEKFLLVYSPDNWFLSLRYLCIPMALGLAVLGINLYLWRTPSQYGDYQTEVGVIAFVERNASWLLIAGGAFLTASAFFLIRPKEPPKLASEGLQAILVFESLSLFFLLFVVMLYWTPYQQWPKNLVLLRHIKTIPFTYGVSFFTAAFIALLLAAIS